MRIALQTLREHSQYAKHSKCEFWLSEVVFFGHVVSTIHIAMDPTKVEAILRWERPTLMTEIFSFLSLAGYYLRFIQGFSSLEAPLIRLTMKEEHFVWIEDCE